MSKLEGSCIISNAGNSCWFNSIIQLLLSIDEFRRINTKEQVKWLEECNYFPGTNRLNPSINDYQVKEVIKTGEKTKAEQACNAFINILKKINDAKNKETVINLADEYRTIALLSFENSTEQRDASEILTPIFKDYMRCISIFKQVYDAVSFDLVSTINCFKPGDKSNNDRTPTKETNYVISIALPVVDYSVLLLNELIINFFKRETLSEDEAIVKDCDLKKTITITLSIEFIKNIAPRYFLIHLRRNYKDTKTKTTIKLETIVIPNKYIKINDTYYIVHGVIIHSGSGTGGHYFFIKYSNGAPYEIYNDTDYNGKYTPNYYSNKDSFKRKYGFNDPNEIIHVGSYIYIYKKIIIEANIYDESQREFEAEKAKYEKTIRPSKERAEKAKADSEKAEASSSASATKFKPFSIPGLIPHGTDATFADPDWFINYFGINESVIINNMSKFSKGANTSYDFAGNSITFKFETDILHDISKNIFNMKNIQFTIKDRKFEVGDFTSIPFNSFKTNFPANPPSEIRKITYTYANENISLLINQTQGINCMVFQAASQFNLLEMQNYEGSTNIPEAGITDYYKDGTQGPRVALASPAGTFFRNYLIFDGASQTEKHQVNTTTQLMTALKIEKVDTENVAKGKYYYANGYEKINVTNNFLNGKDLQRLTDEHLRIGVQWNTPLLVAAERKVTQVYCSALPISYMYNESLMNAVAPLAIAILTTAYKYTLHVAVRKMQIEKKLTATVYLTAVGGSAFKNPPEWIQQAVVDALYEYRFYKLNVVMCWLGKQNVELHSDTINNLLDAKIASTTKAATSAAASTTKAAASAASSTTKAATTPISSSASAPAPGPISTTTPISSSASAPTPGPASAPAPGPISTTTPKPSSITTSVTGPELKPTTAPVPALKPPSTTAPAPAPESTTKAKAAEATESERIREQEQAQAARIRKQAQVRQQEEQERVRRDQTEREQARIRQQAERIRREQESERVRKEKEEQRIIKEKEELKKIIEYTKHNPINIPNIDQTKAIWGTYKFYNEIDGTVFYQNERDPTIFLQQYNTDKVGGTRKKKKRGKSGGGWRFIQKKSEKEVTLIASTNQNILIDPAKPNEFKPVQWKFTKNKSAVNFSINASPQKESTTPKRESTTPKRESIADTPQKESTTPKRESIADTPQKDLTTPKRETTADTPSLNPTTPEEPTTPAENYAKYGIPIVLGTIAGVVIAAFAGGKKTRKRGNKKIKNKTSKIYEL